MASLADNINQAIADFDAIKAAIEESGIAVPWGTDTKEYADFIRAIAKITPNRTYLLQFEDGTELPAVEVGQTVIFDATANDIRAGKTAATGDGVTVGTKDIPAYHITEGWAAIPAGSEFEFTVRTANRYDFTKLQAIICPYNKTISESVAAEKVAIERSLYEAGSTVEVSKITVDNDNKKIKFGIVNSSGKPYIIRYFTYKEEA